MDLSHLDKKYFLDDRRYNCPFCNRGSVTYEIISKQALNWSEEKIAYIYLIKCEETDCQNISMHISYFDFPNYSHYFANRPKNLKEEVQYDASKLDDYFFFHQPTLFFTIDPRINVRLRKTLSEAESCLKMGLLVGASACLRKTIYELVDFEDVRVINEKSGKTNYQESIKKLKDKFSRVPSEYFDALANIQELASDNVHEGSWEAWDSNKLKILIELTKNVLHEMYVIPDEQKNRAGVANQLLNEFKSQKNQIENN